MPWVYSQMTGRLLHPDGVTVSQGYSGANLGYNNPAYEADSNTGPAPRGVYTIGAAFRHGLAGPVTMRLIPSTDTCMFGRDGFLMHGDTPDHYLHPSASNSASNGCIVLPHDVRMLLSASLDRELIVTA